MTQEARLELARAVLRDVQPQRRRAYEESIPGLNFSQALGETPSEESD